MKEISMKKILAFLIVGFVAASTMVFADNFGLGSYGGPSLEPITIGDLADSETGDFVVVSGLITLQRLPGQYVLTDIDDDTVSIIVYIPTSAWSNVEVDDGTGVLVYGNVLKSEQSTEIFVRRVEIPEE
jgi:uncharacterized protein YdeI (BOF family)